MGSGKSIAAWILSILAAVFYLSAGIPKVMRLQAVVQQFEAFGYSADFAMTIGVLETLGAILLLIPAASFFGADILFCVMMGAVYTHLSTGIGSPLAAIGGSVVLVLIVWLRWPPVFLRKPTGHVRS